MVGDKRSESYYGVHRKPGVDSEDLFLVPNLVVVLVGLDCNETVRS